MDKWRIVSLTRLLYLLLMASAVLHGTVHAVSALDTPFIDPIVNRFVSSIALQVDDKILIGGAFTNISGVERNRIARLNSNGTLDKGFNPNADNTVSTVAVQPDGKILIGGMFKNVGTPSEARNHIARLSAGGTLDTGFNPDADKSVFSIVLQSDGKILIGGDFTTVGGVTRIRIARLNLNGTPDTGFNPNADGIVWSIALQADGKILVGGDFTTINGVERNRIARLNSNGTLDMDFNPNADSTVNSIAVQPDGMILIGGQFTSVASVPINYIARLNANGTLDTGFTPAANNSVFSIALQADSSILIGGSFTAVEGEPRSKVARLNPSGPLDMGFNPYPNNPVYTIAVQADGKILLGGEFTTFGNPAVKLQRYIARLNANGNLDTPNPVTVKIEGDSTAYYVIDSTLDSITSDKTVYTRDMVFEENVIMANPVSILLKGGYTDDAFTIQGISSKTVINGSLKIRSGTLRVERLSVR